MPSQTSILSIAGKPTAISQPGTAQGKLRRWTGSGAGEPGGIQHFINRMFRTEEDKHGRRQKPHIMDEKDVTKSLGLDNTDELKIQNILTNTRADFATSPHLRSQRLQHARSRLSDFLVKTKRIPSDVRMEINKRAMVWWRKFGKTDYEGTPMIRHVVMKAQVVSPTLLKAGGPYIGPRGGKWADAKHTIPWKAKKLGGKIRSVIYSVVQMEPGSTLGVRDEGRRALEAEIKKRGLDERGLAKIGGGNLREGVLRVQSEMYDAPGKKTSKGPWTSKAIKKTLSSAIKEAPIEWDKLSRVVESKNNIPEGGWTLVRDALQELIDSGAIKRTDSVHVEAYYKKSLRKAFDVPTASPEDVKGKTQPSGGGGGPFIGPKGGKWADPDHTIPWKEGGGGGRPGAKPEEAASGRPGAAPDEGGGAPGAAHEEPTGQEQSAGVEDGMDEEGTDIPEFKFRITGKDHEQMAARIKDGITKATDMCKLSPPMCHENLGISRADMPQLDDAVLPNFLKSYQDKGISVKKGSIEVGRLKATQKEISAEKATGMADAYKEGSYDPSKKPIIISKDGYVLDGHHRWAAMVVTDPASTMRVYQVDTDIQTLLKDAGSFEGVKQAAFGKEVEDTPAPEAKEPGKPGQDLGVNPKPEEETQKAVWMQALGAARRDRFLRG